MKAEMAAPATSAFQLHRQSAGHTIAGMAEASGIAGDVLARVDQGLDEDLSHVLGYLHALVLAEEAAGAANHRWLAETFRWLDILQPSC